MTIKCNTEEKGLKKRFNIPRVLRSCLPIFCVILFIFYWIILCPLANVALQRKKNNYLNLGPVSFWLCALVIFLIILSIISCVLCCCTLKRKIQNDFSKNRSGKNNEGKNENEKLLHETYSYNSLKKKDSLDMVNEKVLPPKIIKKFDLDQQIKHPKLKEIKPNKKETPSKEDLNEPKDPTVEKIDSMFPRCSVRRKDTTDFKKRPETLVLKPSATKKDVPPRQSLQDEIRPISPLTPREIFFYDLFRSAHLQSMDKTWKFIENERKHSSNNFDNPHKPEIKDFILKQKGSTSSSTPTSPQFFIANVASHNQPCTSEAFMYVDGAQTEKELTICYFDKDEQIFTH